MVMKKTKSSWLNKLGQAGRKAHEEHKDDETTYQGGGDLPAGINGGLAQLVEVKVDEYKDGDNKGELFFYAAGIVISPKEFQGQVIKGERTSITEPLHDTPNRKSRPEVADHLKWVYNELRKLGVNTSEMEFDDLPEVLETLKEEKPIFKFRTWAGKPSDEYPNPRTNHVWSGLYDGEIPEGDTTPGEDDEEVDQTDTKEEGEEQDEEDVDKEGGEESTPEYDLDSLVEQANEGDSDAEAELIRIAKEVGISKKEIDAAPNFQKLAKMIKAKEDKDESEEDEGEEQEEEESKSESPSKGDIFNYRPQDPKTKKPMKKPVECEVVTVYAKTNRVDLRNSDDGKTLYKQIPFKDLEPV